MFQFWESNARPLTWMAVVKNITIGLNIPDAVRPNGGFWVHFTTGKFDLGYHPTSESLPVSDKLSFQLNMIIFFQSEKLLDSFYYNISFNIFVTG